MGVSLSKEQKHLNLDPTFGSDLLRCQKWRGELPILLNLSMISQSYSQFGVSDASKQQLTRNELREISMSRNMI